MSREEYKRCTKKEREAARALLTRKEEESRQLYEAQYRGTTLRALMDSDPLSEQAVNWTKCIIEFMCSIFNLYLRVCPADVGSISGYVEEIERRGLQLKSPNQIFGDSNLYKTLPITMR